MLFSSSSTLFFSSRSKDQASLPRTRSLAFVFALDAERESKTNPVIIKGKHTHQVESGEARKGKARKGKERKET